MTLAKNNKWKFVLYFLLTSCGQENLENFELRARIEGHKSPAFNFHRPGYIGPEVLVGAAPENSSEFTCLGINVVGNGIASQIGEAGQSLLDPLMSGASYCSYPGITSPPISNAATADVNLTVPVGTKRLVQVAGIVDVNKAVCNGGSLVQTNSSVEYFELGRAIVDVFGNMDVNITNTFGSLGYEGRALRKMNCSTGGGSFNATQVGSLFAWYMASSISSCAANSVTTWTDSSGNGRHLNNPSTILTHSPPDCVSNQINGYPIVQFAGGPEYISGTFTTPVSLSGVSIFVVMKSTSVSTTNTIFSFGTSTSTDLVYGQVNVLATIPYFSGTGPATSAVTATSSLVMATGSYYLLSLISDFSNITVSSAEVRINRGSDASQTAANGTASRSFDKIMLGALLGTTSPFYGQIAEILIYGEKFGTLQRNAVECYLKHKYNLTSVPGC